MRTNTNTPATRLEHAGAWPEIVAALSQSSVKEVADQFAVSAVAIRAALRRTNPGKTRRVSRPPIAEEELPPEPEGKPAPKRRRKKKPLPTDALLEPHKDQLGKVSDDAIADLAGVSKWVVRGYRIRQGIPAFNRWADHTPKSAPRTSSKGSLSPLLDHVWRVRFADGSERFAVADSLVDAAKAATDSGATPVTAIERLGPEPV